KFESSPGHHIPRKTESPDSVFCFLRFVFFGHAPESAQPRSVARETAQPFPRRTSPHSPRRIELHAGFGAAPCWASCLGANLRIALRRLPVGAEPANPTRTAAKR